MRAYNIATAKSRYAKQWQNRRVTWEKLVAKLSRTVRTPETLTEYAAMSRDKQSDIKDVGGFVGAYLKEGRRSTAGVEARSLVTLDLDFIDPVEGNDPRTDILAAFPDTAFVVYSTHKHTPDAPRLRIVMPIDRDVTREEYEPIARRVAERIGIDAFDKTTYEAARLFYYPSTSQDGEFVFYEHEGAPLCADAVLATYRDYLDASEYPRGEREDEVLRHELRHAEDPTNKKGVIGAFCRAYTIEDAIEVHLPHCYEKTSAEGRYSFVGGSVAGGLVCYNHLFAYSHHETDPAGNGHAHNAFDLCRVHLYGEKDKGRAYEDPTNAPSFKAMSEFAVALKPVRRELRKMREEEAAADFDGIDTTSEDTEDTTAAKPSKGRVANAAAKANTRGTIRAPKPPSAESWKDALDVDAKGNYRATAANLEAILQNDDYFAGKWRFNAFTNFREVDGLPWDEAAKTWTDSADANLRIYLEKEYNIKGKSLIEDAVEGIFTARRYHPIKDYLNSLTWDGTPRLDHLLVDYLGADDNTLTRLMTRKHFTAAVARIFTPGCKYDYCLILQGAEGVGKSTLFATLAGDWFNDSLITTEGRSAMEQLRGCWVIEMAELASMKHSEVEQVKNFLSRTHDTYREAYGRHTKRTPRQCIFCGTTNEEHFLKGYNGNRRFWIVSINAEQRIKTLKDLKDNRDQIWAEALHRFKEGEPLYLDPKHEAEARERQEKYNHLDIDPVRGRLDVYLNTQLPTDWDNWDIARRQAFYNNPDALEAVGTVQRTRVCAAEFITESLRIPASDENKYKDARKKFNKFMREKEEWGWERPSKHAWNLYGLQRAFFKG